MQGFPIFLVEISFEAAYDSIHKLPLLLEIVLIALFVQHSLEQHKDMSFLIASQISNGFSEPGLVLLCKRLTILHSEVGLQVIV